MTLPFIYDDGRRATAGFRGKAGDCVTRAIAIATETPYQWVYDELHTRNKAYMASHRGRLAKRIARNGTTPRDGIFREVFRPYLKQLGWRWTPTMQIGSGCTVHLRADELPSGRLIVAVSGLLVAVIDGVIHDTYDCSHHGTRCVYGFWSAP
jgi:hypothetical protein